MENQANYRKVKLIKLLDLLRQETDEQHPLSTNQICAKLGEMGIPCDRRTLSQDADVLNSLGYEIMSRMAKHEKVYYIADRSFSVPELKILIDAVQAATFITDKKSRELIQKIAALGGSHRAEILTRNMVCFNQRKHSNESIYYNVDRSEEALLKGKKILFRYFDLGPNGEKCYRRGGHHYVLEPVTLVLCEDNYYILCYSARHKNTANYRVDRMESVEILEDDCSPEALALRENVDDYTGQTFKMFAGPKVNVTLEFSKNLIGSIYDKFGEDTVIRSIGEDRYTTRVQIQKSPTFWGWLFQFAGDMKILKPQGLIIEYKKLVELINS